MRINPRFAVIGHPVGHSMSPFIHNKLFRLSGIDAQYSSIDIPDISTDLSALKELDGFNVTIPHKRNIIKFLDELDEKAEIFGSVNTVLNVDGSLKGFTTDGAGCLESLKFHDCSTSGKLLIIGAGGAARAIASEICITEENPDITVCVRSESVEKSGELINTLSEINPSGKYRLTSFEEEEVSSVKYDLLINCTPVGMYPRAGSSPVTRNVIERCNAVFDCIYNPGKTELLNIAESLNKKTISGIEMLVFQAACAHRYWYGAEFGKEDILRLCSEAAAETARLFGNN